MLNQHKRPKTLRKMTFISFIKEKNLSDRFGGTYMVTQTTVHVFQELKQMKSHKESQFHVRHIKNLK